MQFRMHLLHFPLQYGGEAWPAGRIHRQPALQSNARGGTVTAVQSNMQKDEEKHKKEVLSLLLHDFLIILKKESLLKMKRDSN